ncbi:MAG: IS66 family transposase [Gammaproteobacteria bacterium]|nr:IS66 family transposase [Gammaproteobacteria bacterium]
MFTRKQLVIMAKDNPDPLVDIILDLQKRVENLTNRKVELEQQIKKNSRNSSKPPASDGLSKPAPKSLRKKTGKKTGGQKGHAGHTLQQIESADHTIILPTNCCPCNADLSHVPATGHDCRQVFELPEPKLEVTEYRSEIKTCPDCGQSVKAPFPEMVNAPVQYGPRFRGLLVYLHNQQLIPVNRVSQIMTDLYDAPVSEATVLNASKRSYENLDPFETAVKQALCDSPVLRVDESGARTAGKLHWLHTACTDSLTFYGIHEKRGAEAMDHFDILPSYSGRLIHDFWKPYFTYDCSHGLCNAHHLRELTFLFEHQDQTWAKEMMELLLEANEFVSKQNEQLTQEQKEPWLIRYRKLLDKGWKANPLKQKPRKKKKGRPKKTKAQNLLTRLGDHEKSVLAFLHDIYVPFTNNLAEQDIRMLKIRLKISGCFRTIQGAKQFARIRSYLSTVRKQGRNILKSITDAIIGEPYLHIA